MAVLYRHIRLDKNVPFYIGIGKTEARAYSKQGRSSYWKSIVAKTGYEVEVLFDGLTWEEACKKEAEFIKLYGRSDLNEGTLCNLTDGGEGSLNPSPEIKKIMSLTHKNKVVSEETKKRLSLAGKGHIGYWRGKKRSQETRDKMTMNHARKKSKKVIDTATGIIYPSIQAVATMIGMRPTTLASYLRGQIKNKTTFQFYQNKNNEEQCQ